MRPVYLPRGVLPGVDRSARSKTFSGPIALTGQDGAIFMEAQFRYQSAALTGFPHPERESLHVKLLFSAFHSQLKVNTNKFSVKSMIHQ